MTRKEIKEFLLSLIDNPEAIWSKNTDYEWIYFTCRINNIRVDFEENWKVKFIYIDERGYTTTSEVISLKEIGISKFRLIFPYFGLGFRILRRIKREKMYGRSDEIKAALSSVSEVISKDKALKRDSKIDEILK